MKTPRYTVGSTVLHLSKDKAGKVQSVFASDGGYRYTVLHSGHLWSIPEEALLPISPKKPTQQEQGVTDQVSVSCPAVKK